MASRAPHIYLDTNILLDLYYAGRRPASTTFVNTAVAQDWQISSSHFALMEMIDIVQETLWATRRLTEDRMQLNRVIRERYRRNLPEDALSQIRQSINHFNDQSYSQITYFDFVAPGVLERAMGLCFNSNISAPDCVHVQMAIEIGVDLLVTTDEHLRVEADAWVASSSPDQAITRLRAMNFAI